MYELNHFRRQISSSGKVLLTNDLREYILLTKDEFDRFIRFQVKGSLLSQLEEKGFVLTKKNIDVLPSRFRERNLNLFNGTVLHIIVPTLRCNQNCAYCFTVDHLGQDRTRPGDRSLQANGKFLPVSAFQERLSFLKRSKIDQVRLLGGEPPCTRGL